MALKNNDELTKIKKTQNKNTLTPKKEGKETMIKCKRNRSQLAEYSVSITGISLSSPALEKS